MPTKRRSYLATVMICLALGLASCGDKTRVFSVRNLVEARFGAPLLASRPLTVRAMVSANSIEGLYVRDIGCVDFCEKVLPLEASNASPEQNHVLDQALERARQKETDFACMVLRVKPRAHRSINPNLLGTRYKIDVLEFVEVVDANSCPRSPEDRPLRLDQQPQFTYGHAAPQPR